jgi:hypothetical protein
MGIASRDVMAPVNSMGAAATPAIPAELLTAPARHGAAVGRPLSFAIVLIWRRDCDSKRSTTIYGQSFRLSQAPCCRQADHPI